MDVGLWGVRSLSIHESCLTLQHPCSAQRPSVAKHITVFYICAMTLLPCNRADDKMGTEWYKAMNYNRREREKDKRK